MTSRLHAKRFRFLYFYKDPTFLTHSESECVAISTANSNLGQAHHLPLIYLKSAYTLFELNE